MGGLLLYVGAGLEEALVLVVGLRLGRFGRFGQGLGLGLAVSEMKFIQRVILVCVLVWV